MSDKACEMCKGTGYYGDNGPGISRNNEYHECDCCEKGKALSHDAERRDRAEEEIKKLQSDNSILRTNVDGLEVKNVNLQAKVDGLEIKIDRQQREIDRLRSRDGNATIELCFGDGNHPFTREKLKVCDFGVSDNCYVVESQEINANLKRIKELEAEVAAVKGKVKDALGMLVAYTGEFPEVLSAAEKDLNKALSTPTGSKLLAKIEAGEKMNLALQLVKDQILGGDLDVADYVRVGINSALSAYRATCEGVGNDE